MTKTQEATIARIAALTADGGELDITYAVRGVNRSSVDALAKAGAVIVRTERVVCDPSETREAYRFRSYPNVFVSLPK